MKNTKQIVIKSMVWNGIGKIVSQIIQFVLNVVLARLLLPEDFGLIGMLSIFMSLSQILVQSGFSHAFIQKKERRSLDFSTVFIFDISISIILYFVLFLSAPIIANFFNQPLLIFLVRIYCLTIIINSIGLVFTARLHIEMNFRYNEIASISSMVVSGIIGITFAYLGYGVYALVIQTITRSIINLMVLVLLSKWFPGLKFSFSVFKGLYKFGVNILIVKLIGNFFNDNIYKVMIGRTFSASALGHFTYASKFAELPSYTISTTLQNVTFPLLASFQGDRLKLVSVWKRLIRMSMYISFPVMIFIFVLAKPIVLLFLTENWLPVVPILQWLCLGRMLTPVISLNMNVLNAIGRSDIYMKIYIIMIPITISILFISIPLGLVAGWRTIKFAI